MGTPTFIFYDHFVCLFVFMAAPEAYGSSQARGQIGAAAAGLCHSHSNTRSKPHLQPMAQFVASQVLNPMSHSGNSLFVSLVVDLVCNNSFL